MAVKNSSMFKYLIVGGIVYLMYRFWDTSQKKINKSEDQEPDQDADYEEID